MKKYKYSEVRRPFGAGTSVDDSFRLPFIYPVSKLAKVRYEGDEDDEDIVITYDQQDNINDGNYVVLPKEVLNKMYALEGVIDKDKYVNNDYLGRFNKSLTFGIMIYIDEDVDWRVYLVSENKKDFSSLTGWTSRENIERNFKQVFIIK